MKYDIHILASGPERPSQHIIDAVEAALDGFGAAPEALRLERWPDEHDWVNSEHTLEIKLRNDLLLAVAKLLDGVMAQKCDPESDLWDPKFTGYDLHFSMVDLVERMMEQQRAEEEGK